MLQTEEGYDSLFVFAGYAECNGAAEVIANLTGEVPPGSIFNVLGGKLTLKFYADPGWGDRGFAARVTLSQGTL